MAKPRLNTQYKIFVVEDNTLYAQILKKQLLDDGFMVKVFHNGRDFMASLDEKPDVVTLDYTLPDMTGYDVLKKIQKRMPGTNVIIISAQENINTAIDLMKNGAYDYIMKAPDTREKLSNIIKNIREKDQLRTENILLKDAVKEKFNFRNLIKGNSRE
ncbi:MAG TPA: response regulator, partial [Draconibacterium sp.]|nr:response regulator [Draconibacterium sp.]